MSTINKLLRNNLRLILCYVFLLTYLVVFKNALNLDPKLAGGDALESWNVGKQFFTAHPYHSYVEYRGWLWGAMIGCIYNLSILLHIKPFICWLLFSSSAFVYIACSGIPFIFGKILSRNIPNISKIVFFLVITFFFSDRVLYPLVDVVTIALFILAIHILYKSDSLFGIVLIGIFFGFATMLRLNYIIALPIIMYLIYQKYKPKSISRLFIFLLMVICLQFSNKQYLKAHAQEIGFSGDYVFLAQLTLGVYEQKYEGGSIYLDNIGKEILKKEQVLNNSSKVYDGMYNWLSPKEYLRLYSHYPLKMLGLNARHLFNGVDISIYRNDGWSFFKYSFYSRIFYFFNYMFLAIGTMFLFLYIKSSRSSLNYLLGFYMLLPALTTIPFRVEPRYMLIVSIFIYAFGILSINSGVLNIYKTKPLWIKLAIPLYMVSFILICFLLRFHVLESLVPWNFKMIW